MCNEDAHCLFDNGQVSWALFGVFDGHGGVEMSEHCAVHWPSYIWNHTQRLLTPPPTDLLKSAMAESFADAERALLEEARSRSGIWQEQGTCAVVAVLTATELVVGNVGDSRAVLCDRSGQAVRVTVDHKVSTAGEAEALRKRGGAVDENLKYVRLPDDPEVGISVSRSLGDARFKAGAGILPATPDVFHFALQSGGARESESAAQLYDFLLLCCDGVWDVMGDQEVVDLARARILKVVGERKQNRSPRRQSLSEEECSEVCRCITQEAIRKGSADNVTAVIVVLCGAEGFADR